MKTRLQKILNKIVSFIKETWEGKGPKKEEVFTGRKKGFFTRLWLFLLAIAVVITAGKVLSLIGQNWLPKILIMGFLGFLFYKNPQKYWNAKAITILIALITGAAIFYPDLKLQALKAEVVIIFLATAIFIIEEVFDRGFKHNWYPRWVGVAGLLVFCVYFSWGVLKIFVFPQEDLTLDQYLLRTDLMYEIKSRWPDFSAYPPLKNLVEEIGKNQISLGANNIKAASKNIFFAVYFIYFYIFFMLVAGYEITGDLLKKIKNVKKKGDGGISFVDYFSFEIVGEIVKTVLQRKRK